MFRARAKGSLLWKGPVEDDGRQAHRGGDRSGDETRDRYGHVETHERDEHPDSCGRGHRIKRADVKNGDRSVENDITQNAAADCPDHSDHQRPDNANAEQDFYLHLHLPPELDLPLPATTQIYHKPPRSYLIPRWDLGPDSGAFTRIEFPSIEARKGIQEDVDTFETILAQCTAFLERAAPPKTSRKKGSPTASTKGTISEDLPAYNPADYMPGQAYARGSHSAAGPQGGQIVLVDEEDGSVIGELADNFQIKEDSRLQHGSKGPSPLLPP